MYKLEPLLAARSEKLSFYAPYYFIRDTEASRQMQSFVYQPLYEFEQEPQQQIIAITAASEVHLFFVKHLLWDSEFFQRPVYKLLTVLFAHQDYRILKKAVSCFIEQFIELPDQYCFIDIPAEDSLLTQALNANGFLMIETRLTYFRTIADFNNKRYMVRKAKATDIDSIKNVATSVHNSYDRFHAEPVFSQALADAFLGKYAEEAVKGYCDTVLVPDEVTIPVEAFLTLNFLEDDSRKLNCNIAKIMLTAVAPVCKGWHYKLVSEAIYQAQAKEANYIVMTTQATNKAVIRNCEKLKFNLGSARHILSYAIPL